MPAVPSLCHGPGHGTVCGIEENGDMQPQQNDRKAVYHFFFAGFYSIFWVFFCSIPNKHDFFTDQPLVVETLPLPQGPGFGPSPVPCHRVHKHHGQHHGPQVLRLSDGCSFAKIKLKDTSTTKKEYKRVQKIPSKDLICKSTAEHSRI